MLRAGSFFVLLTKSVHQATFCRTGPAACRDWSRTRWEGSQEGERRGPNCRVFNNAPVMCLPDPLPSAERRGFVSAESSELGWL